LISNEKKSQRREVRFHVDEKGRLERRTIVTTIYGW
jgi:hypothetical protein